MIGITSVNEILMAHIWTHHDIEQDARHSAFMKWTILPTKVPVVKHVTS